jgi:hypothetical protein
MPHLLAPPPHAAAPRFADRHSRWLTSATDGISSLSEAREELHG